MPSSPVPTCSRSRRPGASCAATRWRHARSTRASRSSSSARSSASPPRTSRPAATSTPITARLREFERDYAFAEEAPRRGTAASGGARHLRGFSPLQRQGRHAQLHRHPHQRELLGLGRPLHRRSRQPLRPARAVSQCRRRRVLRPRHRLFDGRQGRRLRCDRAHPVGLCGPSQSVGGPRSSASAAR